LGEGWNRGGSDDGESGEQDQRFLHESLLGVRS
jgi:hypothetical protein